MVSQLLLLAVAAFFAGVMNSVAGGGSFLTFPALVFTGVPSVVANASSTVALFPAAFTSAWAYRKDLRRFESAPLKAMLAVSIAGGVTGALLLLSTPETVFDIVVPWLLLLATLAFAFGQRVTAALKSILLVGPLVLLSSQFLVGIYGGYFGGAVGLIMLGLWTVFGQTNINAMNAQKTLLGGTMNGAAVILFVLAGKVWWLQTATMMAAAAAGGYTGARIARRTNPAVVRTIVTVISIIMTTIFFLRAYR